MSLARHKKPGGFEKLVQFMETTPKEKRLKLLDSMTAEDPQFMDRVIRSMLTFEDFKSMRDEILMEITHAVGNMRVLALALYKWEDQELVDKFKRCLIPAQHAEYKEALESLHAVSVSQREGAQLKLVEVARKIDLERGLRIKPYITNE